MIKTFKHNLALRLDSLGFYTSTLCAIHCAAMPFIFIFLSMYGITFIANPIFEVIFIMLSIFIGIYTFRHGYFKHHKKIYPFLIFISGLIIIIAGHYFIQNHDHSEIHKDEIILMLVSPFGAFLIGLGHYINRKLSKKVKAKSCNC